MCEFKIIKKNDGSQILEDIVVLSYTEDNELLLRDILGIGEVRDSALILEVNTLNQKCIIFEHPLIKDFIQMMKNVSNNSLSKSEIEKFKHNLDNLKVNL